LKWRLDLMSLYSSVVKVEPHGQSPCLHAEVRFGTQAWHLTNAQAGRHPGQKLAHSSTAIPPETGLLPG